MPSCGGTCMWRPTVSSESAVTRPSPLIVNTNRRISSATACPAANGTSAVQAMGDVGAHDDTPPTSVGRSSGRKP